MITTTTHQKKREDHTILVGKTLATEGKTL